MLSLRCGWQQHTKTTYKELNKLVLRKHLNRVTVSDESHTTADNELQEADPEQQKA